MKIKKHKTNRGFEMITFFDQMKLPCSIQKSSLATEDAIWLGLETADPKVFNHGTGWEDYQIPSGVMLSTRMHLTRDQVKELLPYLTKFVKTGNL